MNTRRNFLQNTMTLAAVVAAGHARQLRLAAETPRPEKGDPSHGDAKMERHLNVGAMVYPRMDQIELTGSFEVLSRLPGSTFHIAWKEKRPVRDRAGLILTPEKALDEVPQLDVLVIPGGPGQEDLMEDEIVLAFIRDQAARARYVFSECTGALICGAAGLLRGVRATTYWAAFHLLEHFGAIPVNHRVVVDGKLVTAAGVSAGIDGALRVAALLRGDRVAQEIQLAIEYAPEPPFNSGTPASSPPEIRRAVEERISGLTEKRLATARRVAKRLGVEVKD